MKIDCVLEDLRTIIEDGKYLLETNNATIILDEQICKLSTVNLII